MKKLKFLLLALLCFIATGQCFAQSMNETFTVDGLTYKVISTNPNDVKCLLSGIDKNITDLVVPAKVLHPREGLTCKVTHINCSSEATLQTITFNEGLQWIQGFSVNFVGTSLTYPSTLTQTTQNLFPNLENFYVAEGNQVYKSVDGVLYKVDGNELVAYPPAKTFGKDGSYYTDATTFQIPDGVETVGHFSEKSPFETLLVPASVKTLNEKHNIVKLKNLKYVYVDGGNAVYCDIDGVLCNKAATTLLAFPQKHPVEGDPATYVVPESVTYVESTAFNGADYIKVLDLNNVERVATSAASNAYIEKIIIPACLLDIPSSSLTPKLSYEVDPANPAYFAQDDFLYEKIYHDRENDYPKYDPAKGPAEYLRIMGCPTKKNNFTYVAPENLLVMGNSIFNGKTLTGVQFNAALEKL
ncbi:MAG: leucine-rich repeat protein, partial [Bacteroidales bacterium]|nr:leucine-rich repeat protein [Bacteroidales bacterium]